MAEYNKIVCISFGYVSNNNEFKTASIALDGMNFKSEREIIENFVAILVKSKKKYICGANIILFDIPLLCKKMFSYGIMPPPTFWSYEMKPWLATAIDISDIWRGKARMRDARLSVICHLMGVKSPKEGMKGSEVGTAFYEGKIEDIAAYCEGDVTACYDIFVKYQKLGHLQ